MLQSTNILLYSRPCSCPKTQHCTDLLETMFRTEGPGRVNFIPSFRQVLTESRRAGGGRGGCGAVPLGWYSSRPQCSKRPVVMGSKLTLSSREWDTEVGIRTQRIALWISGSSLHLWSPCCSPKTWHSPGFSHYLLYASGFSSDVTHPNCKAFRGHLYKIATLPALSTSHSTASSFTASILSTLVCYWPVPRTKAP
jgi:hypothetical protein